MRNSAGHEQALSVDNITSMYLWIVTTIAILMVCVHNLHL